MAIKKIGFIGTGIMGRPMAGNLIKHGFELTVFNRTASKAQGLVGQGARLAESPGQAAKDADAVITIVSDTPDAQEVILGQDGAITAVRAGAIVIDMSTISPVATREMSQQLAAKDVEMLDAPVSGGDVGARAGTLAIMVGGSEQAFASALPVFEAMGKTIVHCGPGGAGQTTKLCNQILVSLNMLSINEAFAFARNSGLNLEKVIEAVSAGAAGSWALTNLGPRIARGDFDPGFMVDLLQKDLRLVLSNADQQQCCLPGVAMVHQFLNSAQAHGQGQEGTQSLAKVLYRLNKLQDK